jgi:hypothetical protein
VEKSRSSRLMKTFSVCGAEEELDVRISRECSLTWPVKLSRVSPKDVKAVGNVRDVHE